ncbi:MAG: hypothetical protein M1836_005612 [Candelina mexicana]|nr:MAG: hypothetical protein M1836_005612 [Candelina mexicana]
MIVDEIRDLAFPARDGYQKLSDFMGHHLENAIFRQFKALNVQNLLYLQAEMTRLEAELQEIATGDQQSADSSGNIYHRSWWELSQAPEEKHSNPQWVKVLEIREKLELYNITLLRIVEVFKLDQPRRHSLKILRRWLQAPEYGNFFLRGTEAQIWDQKNDGDLIALSHNSNEQDLFSSWLAEKFIKFFHQTCGYRFKKSIPGDVESGLANYKDTHIYEATNAISTTLAAMLPTLCMFVLYFVKSPLARLGFIMCFSATFRAS